MELWLLRHADAEDRAGSGRDEDRRLTPVGLKAAAASGRGVAAVSHGITLVLTSPYDRARQTAEAAAQALGDAELRETRALEPDRDPEEILSEIEEIDAESILLVAHAPLLGNLLGRLLSGQEDADIPLSKASAAWISVGGNERRGRLRAFLPAPLLDRLGRKS